MIGATRKYAIAFGRFWWGFLVGDTPELFIGVLAVVASALALRHHRIAAIVTVPLVTVVFLAASTYRARLRS